MRPNLQSFADEMSKVAGLPRGLVDLARKGARAASPTNAQRYAAKRVALAGHGKAVRRVIDGDIWDLDDAFRAARKDKDSAQRILESVAYRPK
jgi:hypothetical protein